jgi:hypothetical protein
MSTEDPLLLFPVLVRVRDQHMRTVRIEYDDLVPADASVGDVSDFQRMGIHVQDYVHFKEVNTELIFCAAYFTTGIDRYDWQSFVEAATSEGRQLQLRVNLQWCFRQGGLEMDA